MIGANHNLLLIDDDPRHAKALKAALAATVGGPWKFEWVKTLSSGLDALKLDQSFVAHIAANAASDILISTVITMGRSLKHKVIAEGVEAQEQLAFLQAAGCDEGQGYYFSGPIAAYQLTKLIETGIPATVLD